MRECKLSYSPILVLLGFQKKKNYTLSYQQPEIINFPVGLEIMREASCYILKNNINMWITYNSRTKTNRNKNPTATPLSSDCLNDTTPIMAAGGGSFPESHHLLPGFTGQRLSGSVVGVCVWFLITRGSVNLNLTMMSPKNNHRNISCSEHYCARWSGH